MKKKRNEALEWLTRNKPNKLFKITCNGNETPYKNMESGVAHGVKNGLARTEQYGGCELLVVVMYW